MKLMDIGSFSPTSAILLTMYQNTLSGAQRGSYDKAGPSKEAHRGGYSPTLRIVVSSGIH